QRAGSAVASLQVSLQGSDFGKFVTSHLIGSSFSLADMLTGFVKVSFSLIEGLVIVVIAGIYLASQPKLYRDGLIQLFPMEAHSRVARIIDTMADALQLWLIGQLIQMVLIGLLAT